MKYPQRSEKKAKATIGDSGHGFRAQVDRKKGYKRYQKGDPAAMGGLQFPFSAECRILFGCPEF
jgi:hypothetical protein